MSGFQVCQNGAALPTSLLIEGIIPVTRLGHLVLEEKLRELELFSLEKGSSGEILFMFINLRL